MNYIPELSELRMVANAPDHPIDFGADRDYVFSCLHDLDQRFGLQAFPELPAERISARTLIKQFIVWWRTLKPSNPAQQEAFARLPGAIRLIDTYSSWLKENTGKS